MSIGMVNRAFACAFLGLILCASPSFAQRRAAHPNISRTPEQKRPRPSNRAPLFAPNRYILFLGDEPVAAHFASRDQLQTAPAIAYRRQILSRQQSVIQDLAGRKIPVVGSASMVMNAIFVVATPDRLAELRGVSGVIGVMPERIVKPTLNKATTLANAPAAWAQTAIGGQGNAGNGIKIGILDSGIDVCSVPSVCGQGNPAFNDAGFPSSVPKCNAPPPGTGTPSDCGLYTNNKVIVARSYVSMIAGYSGSTAPAAAVSQPDDYSARDRDGHGSAVAAVAAGVQNGAGTVAFSGMAPKAFLGNYKIYGSPGVGYGPSESVLIQALDDAVSDGMDIINISSGTPAFAGAKDDVQCGNKAGVWCDPLAHAFEVAAENGTVITAAAGNYGSDLFGYLYFNTIVSPGTAPSVISVGATVNSHIFNPTVSVNASAPPANLKGIAAALSDSYFYPSTYGANSGVLVDVTTLGDNGQLCSALPAGSLKDKYALIQQSTSSRCTFDDQAYNASSAGAIGVVFYMAASGTPAFSNGDGGGICYDNSSGYCDLDGPGVLISLSDGQNLKAYVDANPGAAVTIDTAGSEQALPVSSTVNELASYSSLGPAIDGSIKPDMVATGGFDSNQSAFPSATNGMYTVGESYDPNGELFTTNGFAAANGTSFAAPLVAGAAALVKQAHPTWKAAQIKSALVNYSAQDVTSDDQGDQVDVQWIGAGRLDANAAVTASVTASPSALSFGYLATGVALPKPIPVTLTNNGTTSVTLTVAVVPGMNTTTSATVSTDQKSLTLAVGASATLNVTLSGAVPAAGEYSGAVTLKSASPAISFELPYMFLVGDGSYPYEVPLYDISDYQGLGYTQSYAEVNQDIGQLPVQVVDQWGVPVAGATVTYTVTPAGSVSLQPVPANDLAFQPSNCSPSSSNSTLNCTTNNYGIAWVEQVTGATAYGSPNSSLCSPLFCVDATSGMSDITNVVSIIPQPNLQTVVDAVAYGTTVAPGSYVSLFGTNLADPNYLSNPTTGDKVDTTFTSERLPLTMDYVTVSFDAAGCGGLGAVSVPGYVEYVNVGQVNVFVPWELENCSSAQVKMTYAGSGPIFSNVFTVPLSNYVPDFFTSYVGIFGFAVAVDNITGALITTANPATAGEVLQLYCNGLGPVTNQPASGNPAPGQPNLAQTTPVTVSIGGMNAQVYFAGLAPTYVGLYLVDVKVPPGLSSGNQPITVSVGGKTSPASIIAGTSYNIVLPIK